MGEIINLNLDWRFHLGEARDAFYMGYDDRAWRQVTLPHDWAVDEPFIENGAQVLVCGSAFFREADKAGFVAALKA